MRRVCFAVLCLLPLLGCGFEAPQPVRTPPPEAPAVPISMVSASLTIPAAELVKLLNARTKTTIADLRGQPVACAIANCSLDLVVTRTGDITGTLSGGTVSLVLPLAVDAHMEVNAGFFRTSARGEAHGIARTNTSVQLMPDWQLKTQTRGTITLNEGELKLGPVRTNIAELWNHNSAHLSDTLFRTLDREIARQLNVKRAAQRLWTQLQTPIRIGRKPGAWLLLAPQQVFIAQPVTEGDALVLSFGLAVRAHVIVADQAPHETANTTLPAVKPPTMAPNHFAVTIPVLLPYDAAARMAMQRLTRQSLRVAGTSLRVTNLAILPSGRDVIVAARFCVKQGWDVLGWLDSCGAGYLRGVPQYDPKHETIRVGNLHYDVATQNILLGLLKSLSGDTLRQSLQAKLVFNVGGDIARLRQEVTDALAKPRGGEVRARGAIDSFGNPSLTWTRDGFVATFTARGRLSAEISTHGA